MSTRKSSTSAGRKWRGSISRDLVLDPRSVERWGAADDPVDLMALLQQQLG